MIKKNVLLGAVLTVGFFRFNVEAVDTLNQVSSGEQTYLEAVKVVADAIVAAAKIEAERIVEEAKIKAEAEILASEKIVEASEKMIEASEKYGLEAAKFLAPIVGTAICLFAAMKFYSIFNNYR